ncbi:MAG: protein TolR [Hyphomicrobium sp.]
MVSSVKPTQQLKGRRRRGRRHAPMSEINVTPMVDVMLVLLIIFMVAAPLLTVGVPIELPSAKGQQLPSDTKEPLTLSVATGGDVFIGETKVALTELSEKLAELAKSRADDAIYVRGDKGVDYGTVLKVMGRVNAAGFRKISLVSEKEEGG